MAGLAMMSFKGVSTMEEVNKIRIIIKSVDNRKGEHLAYYKSDLMQATFSVYLNDNIFGALALHRFVEMISLIVTRHS